MYNVCYSATDNQLIAELLRQPLLDNILILLNNDKKTLRREACWALSNLTAHHAEVAAKILTYDPLVNRLVVLFEDDAAEVKREVALMLMNCASVLKPSDFVIFCRQRRLMAILCQNLRLDEAKPLLTMLRTVNVLMGVGQKAPVNGMNMLREEFNAAKGIDILEELQIHKLEDVYKEVTAIIAAYYEIEDPI